MIAEISTSLEIGIWLGCLFFIAGGTNQVMKLIDRTKEHPPARDTYQLKGDYATHKELAELRHDLTALADKFQETVNEIRADMKHDGEMANANDRQRAENINRNIQDVMSAVGELRGRIGNMAQDLGEVRGLVKSGRDFSHRGH